MQDNSQMETAITAATAAGKVLKEYYFEKVRISAKESSRDIVSEVDMLAENAIIEILNKYDDSISILTEEQGRVVKRSEERYWIIDALDGTVNYVNHVPFYSVSVAYVERDVIKASAIYAPMFDDIYYASRTIGAFKNNKKISVAKSTLKDSLFSVSFSGKSYDPAKRIEEFILFSEINDASRGCLRTGSAALNLAYLAEGKFSGCWGKANKYWDIAAGVLIAELAGAKLVMKDVDKEKFLYSYLACVEGVWDQLYAKTKGIIGL